MENPSDSTQPDVVVRGTAQLLASVPHLLGYQPGRSVVVMASTPRAAGQPGSGPRPPRAKVVVTARFDLPEPDEAEAVVDSLAHPLEEAARRRGRPLLLHTFVFEADDAVGEAVAMAVGRLATEHGFVLQDLVLVRDGDYLPMVSGGRFLGEDPDDDPTPHGWVPVPAPADVPAVADLVLQGRFPEGSRDDVAARVRRREQPAAAATELALTLLAMAPEVHDPLRALERLGRWVVRGEDEPAPRDRAGIAVALADRSLRDSVMARWLPRLFSVEEVLPPETASEVRRRVPPWPTDDIGALDRLLALTARMPEQESVPLLTITGAVAWGVGEGTVANEAVDRALEVDPGYTMAVLLRQALDRGVAPWSLRAHVA